MKIPDLTKYDDVELTTLLNGVINEQERRANIARIPTEMAEMQARFLAQGGEPGAIAEALAAPLPAPEPDPVYEPVEEAPVLPEADEESTEPDLSEVD